MCVCITITLLKSYCLSLYGCELWNLQRPAIGNICKTWQHDMRRVWVYQRTVGLLLYTF